MKSGQDCVAAESDRKKHAVSSVADWENSFRHHCSRRKRGPLALRQFLGYLNFSHRKLFGVHACPSVYVLDLYEIRSRCVYEIRDVCHCLDSHAILRKAVGQDICAGAFAALGFGGAMGIHHIGSIPRMQSNGGIEETFNDLEICDQPESGTSLFFTSSRTRIVFEFAGPLSTVLCDSCILMRLEWPRNPRQISGKDTHHHHTHRNQDLMFEVLA